MVKKKKVRKIHESELTGTLKVSAYRPKTVFSLPITG